MAAGQLVGGYLGARTGIRFGAKLIRIMMVVVFGLILAKLILDYFGISIPSLVGLLIGYLKALAELWF